MGLHGKFFDCSKCRSAAYCSKAYQAEDWPDHKEDCKRLRTITIQANKVSYIPEETVMMTDSNAAVSEEEQAVAK